MTGPTADTSIRSPVRFGWLLLQLVGLLGVFRVYAVETPAFFVLGVLCVAGFVVHYWLPSRHRRAFYVVFSMAAAFAILEWRTVLVLHGIGLALFAVVRAPVPYLVRLAVVLLAGVGLMSARAAAPPLIPEQLWPVLGGLFMFRMIVYMYDLRHLSEPPSLLDYLSYFYLLPNYYFLLFPVVDYKTMLHTRDRGDIHDVAQVGIRWICRGTIQLLLYRLIEHYRPLPEPEFVTTGWRLLEVMLLTYLLYLQVSGQFHIAIGMLRLYGFDLPETHRRYLLASSIPDFWRRINIYWKDFIAKIAYFPVFFAVRRRGETLAMILATAFAFVLTWALHSYQWFWLRGEFLLTWPDVLFWATLGVLMTGSLLWEQRRRRRPAPRRRGWTGGIAHAACVVATLLTIVVLWSLWQSPTMSAWLDLVTYWSHG
jgi:D-alanyl-lipoteichoic acid acyltransferase DltB (MBOAT superfamily)